MRNYVEFWCIGFDVFQNGGYVGSNSAVGGSLLELTAEKSSIQNQISSNPGFTWTFADQYPPTQGFMLNDKAGIIRMLRGMNLGISTLVRGPAPDYFLVPPDQQSSFRFTIESPRSTGWTDFDGTLRRAPPSEAGKGVKVKPSKITGIWVILRQGLFFAGFEAGSGDPVFVRFLFGTISAHLYLTQAQANTDAVRLRKIYKRPDIPVDVVQI
jgi:hypothetical protein